MGREVCCLHSYVLLTLFKEIHELYIIRKKNHLFNCVCMLFASWSGLVTLYCVKIHVDCISVAGVDEHEPPSELPPCQRRYRRRAGINSGRFFLVISYVFAVDVCCVVVVVGYTDELVAPAIIRESNESFTSHLEINIRMNKNDFKKTIKIFYSIDML